MSFVASIRPDSWELPLFVHVLGALTLIGALALTCALLLSAARGGSATSLRYAVRSVLLGVVPAWIVLRGSAEWIADEEGFRDVDDPPAWIDVGYITADLGFLLILVAGLLGWIAMRRARADSDGPAITTRLATGLVAALILINLVALWAMTTKPA